MGCGSSVPEGVVDEPTDIPKSIIESKSVTEECTGLSSDDIVIQETPVKKENTERKSPVRIAEENLRDDVERTISRLEAEQLQEEEETPKPTSENVSEDVEVTMSSVVEKEVPIRGYSSIKDHNEKIDIEEKNKSAVQETKPVYVETYVETQEEIHSDNVLESNSSIDKQDDAQQLAQEKAKREAEQYAIRAKQLKEQAARLREEREQREREEREAQRRWKEEAMAAAEKAASLTEKTLNEKHRLIEQEESEKAEIRRLEELEEIRRETIRTRQLEEEEAARKEEQKLSTKVFRRMSSTFRSGSHGGQ